MRSFKGLTFSALSFALAMLASPVQAQVACADAFKTLSLELALLQQKSQPRAIIISAPSGGGKTTLMKMLVSDFPDRFEFAVSTTTRQPRVGEVNGKDYEFISVEEFTARIARGEYVEWAEVHGNYYGTSRPKLEKIMAAGRSPLLLVDVQGAAVLRSKLTIPHTSIFVQPPNLVVLEQRLRGRGTDAEPVIQKRLANATIEMSRSGEFDSIIINDKLDQAYEDLKALLLPQPAKP